MFQYLLNDHFIFDPTDNAHFTLAFGAYEWANPAAAGLVLLGKGFDFDELTCPQFLYHFLS
jgi:hypothetical protein